MHQELDASGTVDDDARDTNVFLYRRPADDDRVRARRGNGHRFGDRSLRMLMDGDQ